MPKRIVGMVHTTSLYDNSSRMNVSFLLRRLPVSVLGPTRGTTPDLCLPSKQTIYSADASWTSLLTERRIHREPLDEGGRFVIATVAWNTKDFDYSFPMAFFWYGM
jgi:hypothetical protein